MVKVIIPALQRFDVFISTVVVVVSSSICFNLIWCIVVTAVDLFVAFVVAECRYYCSCCCCCCRCCFILDIVTPTLVLEREKMRIKELHECCYLIASGLFLYCVVSRAAFGSWKPPVFFPFSPTLVDFSVERRVGVEFPLDFNGLRHFTAFLRAYRGFTSNNHCLIKTW